MSALLLLLLAADPVLIVNSTPIKVGNSTDGGALINVYVSGTSSGALTDTQLRASAVPVSGSLTCSVGTVAVTGTFWQTTQPVSGSFWQATQPVSVAAVPLHGVDLSDGGVWVKNFPATQAVSLATAPTTPVTGTFWQATQPVSGTFWQATQPVSVATVPLHGVDLSDGGVWVKNFPATQAVSLASAPTTPVTGTFWQATQPVSGTFWQATQPVSLASAPTTPVTGTFWQATQPVSVATVPLHGVDLSDGGVWVKNFPATQAVSLATAPTTPVTGTFWQATQPVSATFWQATQPVSLATAPALVASSAVIGHVIADTGSTTAVTGNVATTLAASSITGSNPCMNPTATLTGLAGATTGTASVQLLALSGATKVYVCSMHITGVSGTTPTFKLTYGTGTACATGTTGIVGPWTTAANTIYSFHGPHFAVTPAGQALCYVQTGTTPISNYNITYVQQ